MFAPWSLLTRRFILGRVEEFRMSSRPCVSHSASDSIVMLRWLHPTWQIAGQVMERCWFAGRRCLDVGCNSGVLTLALATRFGTASMHGAARCKMSSHGACPISMFPRTSGFATMQTSVMS